MDNLIIVDKEAENTRLDVYLSKRLESYSRSFIQKLIKNKQVLVNNEPAKNSYQVTEGDEIFLNVPPPSEWHLEAENIPIQIIYEDDHIAVINKPAGLVVHPGAGITSGTLVNALLYHLDSLSGIGGIIRPGIVHRLDKNTSGLLVVAKNDKAHIHLQQQFKSRTISRIYQTLVWGNIDEEEGRIEQYIGRSSRDRKKMSVRTDGKPAVTEFKVLKRYPYLTFLKVKLFTGRTHQIRVHFKHLGHPVFGDPEYNGRESALKGFPVSFQKEIKPILAALPYQFLHAGELHLIHPISGDKLLFKVNMPENLVSVLDQLDNKLK